MTLVASTYLCLDVVNGIQNIVRASLKKLVLSLCCEHGDFNFDFGLWDYALKMPL